MTIHGAIKIPRDLNHDDEEYKGFLLCAVNKKVFQEIPIWGKFWMIFEFVPGVWSFWELFGRFFVPGPKKSTS